MRVRLIEDADAIQSTGDAQAGKEGKVKSEDTRVQPAKETPILLLVN